MAKTLQGCNVAIKHLPNRLYDTLINIILRVATRSSKNSRTYYHGPYIAVDPIKGKYEAKEPSFMSKDPIKLT